LSVELLKSAEQAIRRSLRDAQPTPSAAGFGGDVTATASVGKTRQVP